MPFSTRLSTWVKLIEQQCFWGTVQHRVKYLAKEVRTWTRQTLIRGESLEKESHPLGICYRKGNLLLSHNLFYCGDLFIVKTEKNVEVNEFVCVSLCRFRCAWVFVCLCSSGEYACVHYKYCVTCMWNPEADYKYLLLALLYFFEVRSPNME